MSFRPASSAYGRRGDEDRSSRRGGDERPAYESYRPSREHHSSSTSDSRDPPRGPAQLSPGLERRQHLPLRQPDTQASAARKEHSYTGPTNPRAANGAPITPTTARGSGGVAVVLENWNRSQAAVNRLEQQLELKVAALGPRITAKPSEQPSFPEYQNKIRRQLEKEIDRLKEKLTLAKTEHDGFNSTLAVMLTKQMPLEIQNLVQQTISDNIKSYIADLQERTAKQIEEQTAPLLSRIGGLELKAAILEAKVSQTATADPRHDAQQKLIEGLMSRLQAVEDQQMDKTIAKPPPAVIADEGFGSRLAALEASQAKEREYFVQLNKKLTEDVASLRVEMTLLDKKLAENTATLRVESDKVASKVTALSAVVAADYKTTKTEVEDFKTSFEHLTSRLNDADKIVTEHTKRLKRLDFDILEKVAESYFSEWDGIQTAVSVTLPELLSRVDQLTEPVPKVEKQVNQLHQQAMEMKQVAAAVQELQGRSKKFDEIEETMKQLVESVPALQKRAETYDQDMPEMQRRMNQLDRETQEMKHLAASVPKLQERVEKLDAKTDQSVIKTHIEQYLLGHSCKKQMSTTSPAGAQDAPKHIPQATGVDMDKKISEVYVMAQATVTRVKELGKKLGVHEKKLEVHDAGFLNVGRKMLDMIEDCKTVLRKEFNRDLKELENRLESHVAAARFPLSVEDVDSFRVKVEDTESSVAKLDSVVKDLGAKIEKVDYIDHQITALESRCDNISTSKILEAVTARIATMWSNPTALAASISTVSKDLKSYQAKVDAQIGGILQSLRGTQHQQQNTSQSQSPVAQNTQLAGNKRRRTETSNPDGRSNTMNTAPNGNHG